MPATLSLTVEKELSGFSELLPALDRFVEENLLEDRVAYTMRLVVEEVVLNLINHAKAGQRSNEIRLFAEASADYVRLAIEDDSPPFDPRNATPAPHPDSLEHAAPGGIGLHLVRTMVDELSYDSNDVRNRLEVRIRRSREAPVPPAP